MNNKKSDTLNTSDYIFYIIDTISLCMALILSLTNAYLAITSGKSYFKELSLVVLSGLFKYLYLIFYGVTKLI